MSKKDYCVVCDTPLKTELEQEKMMCPCCDNKTDVIAKNLLDARKTVQRPRPGDYYETEEEADRASTRSSLTWRQEYWEDLLVYEKIRRHK
jgi:uncharacterized Zn finger protein (UPF0148 family)